MIEATQLALVVGRIYIIILGGVTHFTKSQVGGVQRGFLTDFHHMVGGIVVAEGAEGLRGAGDAVGDEEAAGSALLGGVVDEVVGLAGNTLQVGFIELVAGRVVALQTGADALAGQTVGNRTRHTLIIADVQEKLGGFIALYASF